VYVVLCVCVCFFFGISGVVRVCVFVFREFNWGFLKFVLITVFFLIFSFSFSLYFFIFLWMLNGSLNEALLREFVFPTRRNIACS